MRSTNRDEMTGTTPSDWRLLWMFAALWFAHGLGWALTGLFAGWLLWGWG